MLCAEPFNFSVYVPTEKRNNKGSDLELRQQRERFGIETEKEQVGESEWTLRLSDNAEVANSQLSIQKFIC